MQSTQSAKKFTVMLLRHGESLHNIEIRKFMENHPEWKLREWFEIEDQFDPKIRDAGLTEKGIQQARDMSGQVAQFNPSLMILSPLTRNLHTAKEACRGVFESTPGAEVHISPILREHTYSTCDLGTDPVTLQAAWPEWTSQLHNVTDRWWVPEQLLAEGSSVDSDARNECREPWQNLQNRTDTLIQLLQEKKEQGHERVLVVGHAVLFFALTGNWLSNCELVELDIERRRPRCGCTGYVCRCDNPEFDCRLHT